MFDGKSYGLDRPRLLEEHDESNHRAHDRRLVSLQLPVTFFGNHEFTKQISKTKFKV